MVDAVAARKVVETLLGNTLRKWFELRNSSGGVAFIQLAVILCVIPRGAHSKANLAAGQIHAVIDHGLARC
jgi:hypothetical protein